MRCFRCYSFTTSRSTNPRQSIVAHDSPDTPLSSKSIDPQMLVNFPSDYDRTSKSLVEYARTMIVKSSKRDKSRFSTNLFDCSPVPTASPVCCRSCSRQRIFHQRRNYGQEVSSLAWTWRTQPRPCTIWQNTNPHRPDRTRILVSPSPILGPPSSAHLALEAVWRFLEK